MNQKGGGLPAPIQGLVVTFDYLRVLDSAKGAVEARKARPCIVVAVSDLPGSKTGAVVVAVVPITHSAPKGGSIALPVADRDKRVMGLDLEPCWVICNEMNTSIWPGYDLLQTPKAPDGWTRGKVPAAFLDQILTTIREAMEAMLLTNVKRR